MSAVSLQWYNVNGMNEMSDITGFSFMSFFRMLFKARDVINFRGKQSQGNYALFHGDQETL